MSTDLIVRFAGEGGQGQVTAAEGLAEAAARVGYHVQTYATYPSQIKGGPTWAQTRISTEPILHDGDALDVLVVLNREAYEDHIAELRDGGVLVYNAEDFELESNGNAIGLAVDELARSTGNPRAANMVVIGAVAALGGMPPDYFEDFITVRFTRGRPNDEQIITANIQALGLGFDEVTKTGFKVADLDDPPEETHPRVVIKGNDALSLGAITAGLDVFVGYPISPATTILVFMEGNLHGEDKAVVQATSEIESISTIIGAGFAGKKTMTSTAGPGFSLMGEGLGFAWMAEIPCVIVDVQRGGPATGLPTKTEQSGPPPPLHPRPPATPRPAPAQDRAVRPARLPQPGPRRHAPPGHRARHRRGVLQGRHHVPQLGRAVPGPGDPADRDADRRARAGHRAARPDGVDHRGPHRLRRLGRHPPRRPRAGAPQPAATPARS